MNQLTKDIAFDYLAYNFNEFTNMDIRALVGRKNSTERWKLIFIKIMLSNKSSAEIEVEHEKINNEIPQRDNETGKLIPLCLPAKDLISFIEQLDAGSIRIKNESIDCGVNLCIQNIGFKKYINHFTNNIDFTYWVGSVGHSTLTETISEQIGLNVSRMRLKFNELNDWFDIPTRDWRYTSAKVVILMPIPIKRETIFCNDRSTLTIQYSITTILLPKLDPVIRIYYINSDKKKIISNISVQSEQGFSNLSSIVTLTIEKIAVDNIRNIESTFYHSGLDEEFFIDNTYDDLPLIDTSHFLFDTSHLESNNTYQLMKESTTSMTRPETPYLNVKLMRDTLEKCQGYIHWVDKYFSRSNLDFLEEANLEGRVNEMKILGSIAICDKYLKSNFKRIRDEMKNKNIFCEMRIIVNRKTFSDLHDRWILSKNINFNTISGDIAKRGQYGEVLVTLASPPFLDWWNESLDIVNNFGEIMKTKGEFEKIKQKKN